MITARSLRKSDYATVETLFGPTRGACGGCWCMHWRFAHGGKTWYAALGEPNRKAFKKLIESGKAQGVLAFDGKTPIGWCSFGKRVDFLRTETVKALRPVAWDSMTSEERQANLESRWSINCFYIATGYRNLGVSRLLAKTAVAAMKKKKARIIEGYPVPLPKDGKKIPAAFAWTGTENVFRKLGFKRVQLLTPARPYYELRFK